MRSDTARPDLPDLPDSGDSPAAPATRPPRADRGVSPEAVCHSEPVLIDLHSLLTHLGVETLDQTLQPALRAARQRLHLLKHDVDALDALAGDPQAPGHARALQVRTQLQSWIQAGLLVTVRHAPLPEGMKPAAMARFFGLFGVDRRGCLITQSRDAALQMLGPAHWDAARAAPLCLRIERGQLVALPVARPTPPHSGTSPPGPALAPDATVPRPQPVGTAEPATRRTPAPAPAPARRAHKPRASAEQQRRLADLVERGYLFVPDTSALMFSQRQTARRFFERELLPRLTAVRPAAAATPTAPAGRVWVLRRVRGELMRHAQAQDDPARVARAADGLKALTMLADAGLVVDHDDTRGPRGVVDSYADPALELLLRKEQGRRPLCIVTQDRALAAKLLVQRDDRTSAARAEILRLRVDGSAALEDWEDLLSQAEREQAEREVSVDARVEAQIAPRSAPAPAGSGAGAARRPLSDRAERAERSERSERAADRALANGARTLGTLKHWKAEQAYGFVQPDGGGPDLFLHVRALPPGSRTPREGDRLTCLVGRDEKGRLRAERAWPEEAPSRAERAGAGRRRAAPAAPRRGLPLLAALALVALLALGWWLGRR